MTNTFLKQDNHWIRGQIYPDPLWESNMLLEDLQLVEDTDICYYKPVCIFISFLFQHFPNISLLNFLLKSWP